MHATTNPLPRQSVVIGLIKLMRPRQWVKNTFVLAPLIFAGLFLDADAIVKALWAAVLFCVASSATYALNDLRDIEGDRKHPVKSKTRPLASGQILPAHAIALLSVLYLILGAGFLWHPALGGVILTYLLLNFAYTLWLKQQPVIDIFVIAIGFVLRVYAGAVVLSVPISSWMFVTTLCLALYLASIKRRQELVQRGDASRKVLEQYTLALIDRYAEIAATGALLFYSLFVMTARPEMVITIPLVLYGLFRYWFIVECKDGGESPTDALLTDWQLLLTVAAWAGACMWALWPGAL